MPALVVFGRRSRVVGSDDLYCPALVLLLFQLPLLAVCAVYLALWRRCSTLTLDESGLPFWFMLAAVPMLVFMACIDLMVLHVSAKGTIVDYERRMVMPRVLHVHTLWSALTFAFGLAGVALWYFRDLCYPDSNFVLGVASCMVAEVSFTFTLGFCLLTDEHSEEIVPHTATGEVDPYGNALGCERQSLLDDVEKEVPNSDVYVPHSQSLWKERCTRCCACMQCFTCNLFGGAGTRHDSMSVVARVFSRLFYGSPDLVISDIIAGFILLAAVQAYDEDSDGVSDGGEESDALIGEQTLGQLRAQARNGSFDGHEKAVFSTSSTATYPSPNQASVSGSQRHLDYSSISIPPVTGIPDGGDHELATSVEELAHFSQYAIGIYGWMLYVWSHPWSGTFRLAFSCMKRNLPYIHGDNWFHLGQMALQLETKVNADDIVYASFTNTVYRPAFCVVLDHARKEVVIAIRGTLSLEDCLTDAIAYGMSMDGIAERWGCDGAGEYAHQGFLNCAEAIYLELNRLGILEMLFDPHSTASIATDVVNRCERGAYKDYGLVTTGHSLGAGTAVLLSVMLRPKYPNLRCFAFSPPGCTLSPGIAKRCAEYTLSVVVGDDIIARSSLTSAEAMRDQVLDLIRRSKVGKASILRQVVAWKRPEELLHDENACEDTAFSVHLSDYRTMLQRIQASEPINPLTIPGRIIHLRRSTHFKAAGGCWVCCRPGADGICCTSRTNYQFGWSTPRRFANIRIARTMLDDHFPDKVHYVLQDCVKRMQHDKKSAGMQCIG